jgi:integrase
MGRRRKHNKHLPERVYLRGGSYFYVVPDSGKWVNLGRDYAKAMAEFGHLSATSGPVLTMSDLIDRYLREEAPTKAPRTYRDYLRQARLLRAYFGRMAPADVMQQDIYAYQAERKAVAPVQANREISLLSSIFSKAVRWGVIGPHQNQAIRIEKLKEKPRDRYVTDAELRAFAAHAGPLVSAYSEFQYLTGLRQGDILALRLDQLKDDGIHVTVAKTKRPLIIEWSPALTEAVRQARTLPRPVRGMYLLCTRTGQRYSASGFRSIWHRHMTSAVKNGILKTRFTTHDVRAKAGSDAPSTARATELLAHRDTGVTNRHYRRLPERVKPLK